MTKFGLRAHDPSRERRFRGLFDNFQLCCILAVYNSRHGAFRVDSGTGYSSVYINVYRVFSSDLALALAGARGAPSDFLFNPGAVFVAAAAKTAPAKSRKVKNLWENPLGRRANYQTPRRRNESPSSLAVWCQL